MPQSPLDALKVDDWDRMIDVNIKGVLYGIAAALPHMQRQESGHIINVSSVAGHKVGPGCAVYSATKLAVRALSEGSARRWRRTTSARPSSRPAPWRRSSRTASPIPTPPRGMQKLYNEVAIPADTLRPRRRLRDQPARRRRRSTKSSSARPGRSIGEPQGRVVSPAPSGRCIITVSTQRSNLKPTARKTPVWAKPALACRRDRAGVAAVADHRQHLPRAGGGARLDQRGEERAGRCRAGSPPGRGRSKSSTAKR